MNNVKAAYDRDGFYLATDPLISPDLVQRAIEGMDAVRHGQSDTGRAHAGGNWKPGDDPAQLCKIEQPQFASSAIRDLLNYPALGEMAAAVTGASMVQVWWVQLLYKPPTAPGLEPKTNIGLHQDRQYWGQWEEGSEIFTAWVALSDVEADCGPMTFVRGSHRWGLKGDGNFWEQDVDGQRQRMSPPEGETWDEVSAILPSGGASFHHNLTFHGSGPNHSDRPRRSFAIHMRTQDSRPVGDRREGLTAFIDDMSVCPIIYDRREK